jgi:OOP family OmpA-OmpF porin
MMKKVLVASLLSTLIAVPAFAAVPGGYVAADLQSWSTTNNAPFGNPGMGLRIGAGYRFTPNVGVEVDYAQSGSSSSNIAGTYKVSSTQVAVVGTMPVSPEVDVFGKVGMAANKLSLSSNFFVCVSCSKTSLMYGIGAQYNFNQQVGLRLQYENLGKATNSGVNDLTASTLSLGVVYAF